MQELPDRPPRRHAVLVTSRSEAWLPVARRACVQALVDAQAWSGGPAPSGSAAVVLAGLKAGERRIPEEVLGLVSQLEGEPAVLLLCEEALARPSLALLGGRVTLLGGALTEERIAARLRVLLATGGEDPPGGQMRERTSRQAWVGVAAAGGAAALPLLDQEPDRGLTAVLSATPVEASTGQEALEVCRRDDRDEVREQGLAAALGGGAGLVHLSAGREWLLHWPDPAATLSLFSPLRLPAAYSLADAMGRAHASYLHLAAATADVLLAVWGPPLPATPQALASAAATGGPALLDLVAGQLAARSAPSVAVVVEVR